MEPAEHTPSIGARTLSRMARIAFRASVPSLALGLLTRILLFVISATFDTARTAEPFVVELLSRVSWSLIVCLGLAVTLVATKQRALAMGSAGIVAAPTAFFVSRGVRRGAVTFLRLADAAGGPSPIAVAVVKGLEYAVLGLILGYLGQRVRGKPSTYGLIGGAIGLGFGSVLLALTASASTGPLGPAVVLSWCVNEVLFPVGCSLVIFLSENRRAG